MIDAARSRQLRGLATMCAVAGAAIGAVVLTGWVLGNDDLKGGFIAGITAKTNTAIALLLAGLGLLLLAPESRGLFRTILGRACATLAMAIGLLTLSQHVIGWDLRIDEWYFREPAGLAGTQSPNRMGPPAAVMLSLLGLAMWLMDRRPRRDLAPAALPAVVMMAGASLSLLGYVFGVHELYGIARYTGIAFLTAVAYLLLGIAVLGLRPEQWPIRRLVEDDSGTLMIRRLLPAAILLPIVLTLLRNFGERRGLYDPAFGRVLMAFSFILTFVAIVWWTSRIIATAERRSATAEADLRSRLVHSLESMTDVFMACDAGWRISYANAAAERVTGMTRQQLVGRHWWQQFDAAAGTTAEQEFQRAMSDRVSTRFEIFYEPYGRRFDVQVFPTADGGLATYGRDITEQWRANELLLDADRRKDRFLATLAHELRNPLAPVRNAVKLLQLKGTNDPDIRWAHAVVERQVDHLTRLIDDLMDVSRISHDRLELRPTRVRLADVIAGAVESSRPIIDAHRHQLSISLPTEPVYLKADAVRLAQVFVNLLTNAAKYTGDAGRIVVTATIEGGEVVVRVADSGVGFDRDDARRLFEMFYQGRDILGRQHGGLGVGLALAQHLVKLHGGSIAASSSGRGRGSEFTVRLPMAGEQEKEDAADVLSPRTWSPLAGHRVLIVDDNEDAAASLGVLFQLASAEVHLAHSGAQALAVAARFKPEVTLLDIGLPDLSGYEVAREIRQSSWATGAVLIALTGWGQPEDRERSVAAGFDRHLVKPAQPDELMACVLDALPEKGTETTH